jgi:hypothetical protein
MFNEIVTTNKILQALNGANTKGETDKEKLLPLLISIPGYLLNATIWA